MWATVLLIAVYASATNGEKSCTLFNGDASKQNQLDQLKPLNGRNYTVAQGNVTYELRWCDDVGGTQSNASVVRKENKNALVIGRFNKTDVVLLGNAWFVTFGDGDHNVADNNKEMWKAFVEVQCSPKTDESFIMLQPMNAAGFVWFQLNSSAVCSPPPAPKPTPSPKPTSPPTSAPTPTPTAVPPENTSRWTVFFMLIITAGLCYLVIGMAYRRFVLGAKGLEQIPNYDFWRDPCGYTRDYCNRRELRRNEPWSHSNMNDNVDEPLLHP